MKSDAQEETYTGIASALKSASRSKDTKILNLDQSKKRILYYMYYIVAPSEPYNIALFLQEKWRQHGGFHIN